MHPWAKRLLLASMLLWTVLTALAGWYALRGDSTPASASNAAIIDVKRSDGERQVQSVSRADARKLIDDQRSASAVAAPPAPNSLRAAPQFASNAGTDANTRSLDPRGPRSSASLPSKGVIVLDPGHGRGDPGAVHRAPNGLVDLTEADSNLRNAELIRDNLIAMGYEVYLTRNGAGDGPGGPLPLQFITSDLFARVALAKAVDAQLYLAIHANGATVPSISGPETWYCGRRQQAAANEKLAGMVQQAAMEALREYGYAPPDRGIKEDAQTHHSGDFCQFVVTRETPVPAALLEFLFLTNDDDARVLLDDRAHVLMARRVADAIDAFMNERSGQPAPRIDPGATGTPSATAGERTATPAPAQRGPAATNTPVVDEGTSIIGNPDDPSFHVPPLIDPPTATPEGDAPPGSSDTPAR